MTKGDLAELETIISLVVQKELKKFDSVFRMVTSVGDGEIEDGVDAMRENHKWISLQRERGNRVSAIILYVLVTSVLSGALYALWEGLKKLIGG